MATRTWSGWILTLICFLGAACSVSSQAQLQMLTIIQGAGSGEYAPGTVIEIEANPAPAGVVFDRWTGDIEGIASPTASATTLVMPDGPIAIVATYRDAGASPAFILTVISGTGDGSYTAGTTVTIIADAPPAGMSFLRWTGDTSGLQSATASSTELTMPSSDIQVTATYTSPPLQTWPRQVVSLNNASSSGNPFEIEVDATFTHTSSGTKIKMPGYYAGNDTWKINFMPTKAGEWTYTTTSSDSDLNGQAGSMTASGPGGTGILKADPAQPRKWKFTGGGYVIPIALRMEFFSEPATQSEFEGAADFMKNNELLLMETRLTEELGQYGGRHDFVFEGDWRNHVFDLANWDRMEARMDALAARGLGAHIMFYSDDAGTPGWSGQSDTERLVIRYAVARLAAYPAVVFNTGIDISEYRSASDVDWMGARIRELDPYGHPVSSRRGGGSGSSQMAGKTFDSRGNRTAAIQDILFNFNNAQVPVSQDDAWGENRGSHLTKDHTPSDIRRAFWKCVVAGGVGGLIRGGGDGGSVDGFYRIKQVASDLESEQWLKLVNPFVRDELGKTFGEMVPSPSLVGNGYALADPARTRILYFLVGTNDTYDSGDGQAVTVLLSGLSKDYDAFWFDPRSGVKTVAGTLVGGQNHDLNPPSTDDWILLLNQK